MPAAGSRVMTLTRAHHGGRRGCGLGAEPVLPPQATPRTKHVGSRGGEPGSECLDLYSHSHDRHRVDVRAERRLWRLRSGVVDHFPLWPGWARGRMRSPVRTVPRRVIWPPVANRSGCVSRWAMRLSTVLDAGSPGWRMPTITHRSRIRPKTARTACGPVPCLDEVAEPGLLDERLRGAYHEVGAQPPDIDGHAGELRGEPADRGRADQAELHLVEVHDSGFPAHWTCGSPVKRRKTHRPHPGPPGRWPRLAR